MLKNNINAFCLTHTQGDFITLNTDNEKKQVLVRSKSQLFALAKIAEEDGGSPHTIENLKKRKVIPFFDSLEYWQVPASQWEKYLFPATPIPGDSEIVWTIVGM
jgi:hypothetical protein